MYTPNPSHLRLYSLLSPPMAAAARLRITPHSAAPTHRHHRLPPFPSSPPNHLARASAFPSFNLASSHTLHFSPVYSLAGRGGGGAVTGGGGGGGSGGGRDDDDDKSSRGLSILGLFFEGWRSRVAADPQFPFKVLMEELVGVTACVIGDMASRPNFGLNELDFVFSTLVVGSILNFVLMYLLAPTSASAAASRLPSLFAGCPSSHMFEPGAYSLPHRLGTFVYKGAVFAAVGFAAGLVGTAISNGLIGMRKKMDPSFESPNKPPPTLLNAATWAGHMGLSSNLRYQSLNGLEFVLAKVSPPAVFKGSVVVLRCANNILGGVSFVALARLTGSQKPAQPAIQIAESGGAASVLSTEKEKLMVEEKEDDGHLQESHSTDK